MITKLHVKNYKCLRDVSVELTPFTVLIGKNDTGKSSLLEAIQTLGRLLSARGPVAVSSVGIDRLAWRGADPPRIEWEVDVAPTARNRLPGLASYTLRVAPSASNAMLPHVDAEWLKVAGAGFIQVGYEHRGSHARLLLQEAGTGIDRNVPSASWPALAVARTEQGLPTIKAVASALDSTKIYRLDPEQLSRASAQQVDPDDPGREPELAENGYGLPSVLDYLLGAKRKVFDDIERELHEAAPFVRSIQLKPARIPANGSGVQVGKSISFELDTNGYEIPASLASSGVMLFLAYLTLVHGSNAPATILIEEPENGIHPTQLKRIAEYLRRLTDPVRGANAVQIVVATHSPYFLDFVPAEDVLVLGRRQSGETAVAPLIELPGVKQRLQSGFSLGEMWFNVGEDRLLAEVLK